MTRPKRNPRPDANQAAIVEELTALGFDVDNVSRLPGLYDLVVSGLHTGGQVCSVRVEIKTDAGELNETERDYHAAQRWGECLIVARKTEDIVRWFDG